MTREAWLAQIAECGGDMSQDSLINLIFKDGPNAIYQETVNQMHVQHDGMYSYLSGLFPARVWNDWQGTTELGETYHAAYVPFDMSIFQRSMQICSPDSQDECHTDYCEIPRGGITHLPEVEMYKTGFKTEPMCIANIRTSKKALQIAQKIIAERFSVDEQVMNIFYTMALIRMLGHKWVLEYSTSGTDIVPFTNTNPYNVLGGFQYNYLNPLFPAPSNINNIMPLDLSFLDMFGRALVNQRNPNSIATGPRGAPIFELWAPNDVYQQEMLDNHEYIERMKYTMPTDVLLGYTNSASKEKEIIGNFSFRQNPNLPRFAESTTGGLAVVQPMVNVPVDGGNRAIHNSRQWDNAPFYMMCALGKGIGEILSRPSISTGIEGRPIMPITGNGDWQYRNDYDKECNEDLNKPHFRKRFEMGFRLLNGDAGWGFIGRSKKFRLRPVNTCALNPIFAITPAASDCSILTIGCNPLNKRVNNNIITEQKVRPIICTGAVCGDDTIFRLTFQKQNQDSIVQDQNPLSCDCGDTVTVIISDENGVETRQLDGTLLSYVRPNVVTPNFTWYVKLEDNLEEGECVTGVVCEDDTPTYGNVVNCIDDSIDDTLASNKIRVGLDSLIADADVGDSVTLKYYDASNVLLGTIAGTISAINRDTFTYEITSVVSDFGCTMYETQVTMRVTLV